MTTPSSPPAPDRPTLGRVVGTGLVAAVSAAVVVAIVAFIEGQLLDIEASFQPLTPPAAAVVTLLYTFVGVGVLVVVTRVAEDPRRTFIRLAIAGLALSFVPQITLLLTGMDVPLGDFTLKNVLAVSFLHLVAAAVALPIMLRVFRP